MTTATATKTATYKGREYVVLFLGETKFGRRARLQFMDGSKDFWVDAALVGAAKAGSARRRGNWPGQNCPGCGSEPLDNQLSCWECGFRGRG